MATKKAAPKKSPKKENLPAAKAQGNAGASPPRDDAAVKKPVKPIKS